MLARAFDPCFTDWGLDNSSAQRLVVGVVRLNHIGFSRLWTRHNRAVDSSARRSLDKPFLEYLGRRSHEYRTGGFGNSLCCTPGLSNDRRDCSHGLSQTDFAETSA